jgi:hypothetical protein
LSVLLAGVARANITPPAGIELVGFAGRGPSEAIHDDLLATTLALEADGRRAIVIAADVLGFSDQFVREVRAEIARRLGTAPLAVLLCASHTHYGPSTGTAGESELAPDVVAYLSALRFHLAGSAQVAVSRLAPARVGLGEGEAYLGVNRRERLPDGRIILGQNPAGPCDRQVRVVRLDDDGGRPVAALVNFACHPVSAGGKMREISADFIGGMRQLVEAATGATCLFLQGAAGNINPVEMRHSFEPSRRLGVMLGGAVAHAFEATATTQDHGLAAASARVDLPAMTCTSLAAGEAEVTELASQLERLRAEGAPDGALYWAESRLRHSQERCQSWRTGVPLPPVSAELAALRLGGVALATAPGEIFTETGMAVKARSPIGRTLFAAYTDGSIGYVPVPSAYPEGGYEVTHACRVAPEAAGMIEQECLELLGRVMPSAGPQAAG